MDILFSVFGYLMVIIQSGLVIAAIVCVIWLLVTVVKLRKRVTELETKASRLEERTKPNGEENGNSTGL